MNWTQQELQDLLRAGKIAQLTLDKLEAHIKPGVSIASLHDNAIKLILGAGADLAFPPNISLNECAAHDSAAPSEKRIIPEKALVKIDVGANVNGMLSDSARTISTDGRHGLLIKAAKDALKNAIEIIKPGLRVSQIGEVVQDTIEGYGFKPISNLTGHQLEKGQLHAGFSIPSVKSVPFAQRSKLKKGMILALEPFSTNGSAGYIEDSGTAALIYSSTGNPKSEVSKILVKRFKKVPFSLRYALTFLKETKNFIPDDLGSVLSADGFHGYRPLIEKSRGMVAQAEHTVLVTGKGARIIT